MNIKNQILFVKKIFFSLFLIATLKTNVFAQDIRSGDIIVSHISGYTYQTKIKIYQDLSTFINRPYILINWGDEINSDTLFRIDSATIDSLSGVKITMYNGIHTYAGTGVFVITYQDSFLVTGITNIANSENENFCLRDTISIPSFPILFNSSPYFNNLQPISLSCCNWSYNSGAVDPDGDSLSYSLAPYTCVSNYSYPNGIIIDSITGTLSMHPTSIGKFAVGIKIEEWKKVNTNYILIGSILRPMLLNVDSLWSVNTNEFSTLIDIFPNPASNYFNILFNRNDNLPISINIYNIEGVLVKQEKNIDYETRFETTAFTSGLYIVELKTKKGNIYRKIVIE